MKQSHTQHAPDWNAKLVAFFLKNPRLVVLVTLAIVIGGVVGLSSLRREGFPGASPKIVLVQTLLPGASSEEVDIQVTKEIEEAVKDAKHVKNISSTSQNSFSIVVVSFEDSSNIDQDIQDVQAKVQSARNKLPADAEQPKVSTLWATQPSFIIGVSGTQDKEQLRVQTGTLAEELRNIKGIKSASFQDEPEKRVLVTYRAGDLAAKGVSAQTVAQVLAAGNVDLPIKSLAINDKQQSLVSKGAFGSLDDIRHLIVGATPTGPILLQDVATIEEQVDDGGIIHRFGYIKDGKLVDRDRYEIVLAIDDKSDIITVKKSLDTALTDLRATKKITPETDTVFLVDEAKSTDHQISEILEGALGSKNNLWILGGLQLLFLAMLLFVNFRAAFVAALSIPLSLLFTFISLYLLGINLNTIVLFSLILVLGLIVDPAIVMVEAIQRYRDLRYPSDESVLESGRRYGAALFMAVFTSVLVFIPFGVVSGVFGEIIKYIPLTVMPALIASYLVPMGILPLFSKWMLKPRTAKSSQGKKKANSEDEDLSSAARFVMKVNTWTLAKLSRQIGILALSLVLVSASISIIAAGKIQLVQFSKPADNNFLLVYTVFPKGQTTAQRDEVTKKIEQKVAEQDGVASFYYTNTGYYNLSASDALALFVTLKDAHERTSDTLKSKKIAARILEGVKGIDGIDDKLVFEISNSTPDAAYQIQTQIYANDTATLEKAARDVGDFARKLDHVTRVDDGFTNKANPTLYVRVDRDKVQQAGLSSYEFGAQIKSLLDPTQITKFQPSGTSSQQPENIFLVSDAKPKTTSDLEGIPVISRTGARLSLRDVAHVEETNTTDAIQRFNGRRFVTIQVRVAATSDTFAVQDKMTKYLSTEKQKQLNLIGIDDQGDASGIQDSFQELFVALGAAVLLTYIVLVIQFGSFTQPIVMLFTIPLSFVGVFPALWAVHADLGFLELLGITILVGIVENVAIFLIDYANQLRREQGMDSKQAIILASGVRFRPILLTKLVALGGLLPLAIESPFWRGLSVVIIAGIGVSGFFSLVVIPILYTWINRFREFVHKKFAPKG